MVQSVMFKEGEKYTVWGIIKVPPKKGKLNKSFQRWTGIWIPEIEEKGKRNIMWKHGDLKIMKYSRDGEYASEARLQPDVRMTTEHEGGEFTLGQTIQRHVDNLHITLWTFTYQPEGPSGKKIPKGWQDQIYKYDHSCHLGSPIKFV